MANQVIMWQCEHCKQKQAFNKKWVEKHEQSCMANPNSKNCFKCKNYIKETKTCSKCDTPKVYYTALTCTEYEQVEYP